MTKRTHLGVYCDHNSTLLSLFSYLQILPFGRTLLRSSFRKPPEDGPSRESKNPGTAPFPLQQSPASQAHSPSPRRAHAHECPRCRRCRDPKATAAGHCLPRIGRRLWARLAEGPRGGAKGAAPPGLASRPPCGYTEGRARAQPAFCSAATRALLSARTSDAAAAPPAFPGHGSPTCSSRSPSTVLSARPWHCPSKLPSLRPRGGAAGEGLPGRPRPAEGLGRGRRGPRPAARSCPEAALQPRRDGGSPGCRRGTWSLGLHPGLRFSPSCPRGIGSAAAWQGDFTGSLLSLLSRMSVGTPLWEGKLGLPAFCTLMGP